jgi:hypothetical protein
MTHKELRESLRYLVHWKIALVFDEAENKPIFHGRTFDLSLEGTAMLTRHNVFSEAPVTALLAPPPLHRGERKKVIEIHALQIYSVYSGATECFRLGLQFLKFKDDGFEILKERLTHHQPSYYKGDKLLK